MKILIISNHSYMLYQFRRELIQKLMETNEVILCMPFVGHEDEFLKMGLRCINISFERRSVNPFLEFKLFQTIKRIIIGECPNLVITYSIKPNIYAGLVSKKCGLTYCANIQGMGTAFEKKPLCEIVSVMYRAALAKAKVVFFENESDAEVFLKLKITSPDTIAVLPGAGVNLDIYRYQPLIRKDAVHFLFVGRIMKEKGIDELLEASYRLKQIYGHSVVVDIVGFYEDEYQAKISDFDSHQIVKYHGFQQDIRPFYKNSDCVVLPSYHEGLSNVLLEAAASGRALIASDIPGCRETIVNGVSGLLCEARNTSSLYQAMEQVMNLGFDRCQSMGIAGREHVKATYEKNSVVNMTIDALMG